MILTELLLPYIETLGNVTQNAKEHQADYQAVLDATQEIRYSQSIDAYSLDLSFSGGPEVLAAAFKAILNVGFTLAGERPKEKDPEWSGLFTNGDGARVFVRFTSTECVRKQVGTELVEVPVYETVCSEESETTES